MRDWIVEGAALLGLAFVISYPMGHDAPGHGIWMLPFSTFFALLILYSNVRRPS